MGGEFSKMIGEIGEQTVLDFLSLIGWNVQTALDIPCIDSKKHGRKSHGIDGYFHYESPMISNTLENVLISTKYSSKGYGSDIINKFKENFKDITSAIECFKRSSIRNEANNSYSNINFVFDRGVIFQINNADSPEANIIDKLSSIEVPVDNKHDGVILVDNGRINFLYDAISFVKNEYIKDDVKFVYLNTGLNNSDCSKKDGKILPFQYLASDIIPFKIQSKEGNKTFLICTRSKFSENEFMKLLGVAKNSSANFEQNVIIAFPDYNKLSHGQSQDKIKRLFNDEFSLEISAISYNKNFRL